MATPTALFDYALPPEWIAQHSVEPRDHSRLMCVDRRTGALQHRHFYDVLDELRAGDVLVMNNTKVFRARLEATISSVSLRACQSREQSVAGSNPSTNRRIASSVGDRLPPPAVAKALAGMRNDTPQEIELLLLRPRGGAWDALVKPGRHVRVGDTIRLGAIEGIVLSKSDVLSVQFDLSDQELIDYANDYGQIPVPPYVHEIPERLEDYQTVYASQIGSVAAPTAGFHFTTKLLQMIRAKGVEIHEVTLHVGIGTFRPMKSETLEEHQMHSEFVSIDSTTAQAINRAKQEGRRVIAVGTTTVRTLEGVARDRPSSQALPAGRQGGRQGVAVLPELGFSGDVNLFITPGFAFRVVDALITNFHLPKSTLLVLVSAFAGREHILAAYEEAVARHYRFFSFGDAMFIR